MFDETPAERLERLVKLCDDEIARLEKELTVFEADPRKLAHFRRLVAENVKGPRGCSEDELRKAAEEDYFWSVEEIEAMEKLAKTKVMREHFLEACRQLRDED